MDKIKPHRGTLTNWHRERAFGGGYVIVGVSHGHPEFHGAYIHTSGIVAERPEINEVETRNSRYSLEQPALSEAPPGPQFSLPSDEDSDHQSGASASEAGIVQS